MISIIIPTYCPHPEVEEKLARCMLSITLHTVTPHELIIVEQGARVYDKYLGANVYMHSREPIGFARAVNLGVAASNGEHLFIVNNDIVVPPRWDEKLLAAYQTNQFNANGNGFGLLSPIDQDQLQLSGDRFHYDLSWWSCVVISRRVWDDVGPLDDIKLKYRYHDQDWSIRARMKGYAVARYGGVMVQHDEASTYRHMRTQVDEGAEAAEMVARYGVPHFFQWVVRQPRR